MSGTPTCQPFLALAARLSLTYVSYVSYARHSWLKFIFSSISRPDPDAI